MTDKSAPFEARCAHCGMLESWHSDLDGACPDDDYPHPDAESPSITDADALDMEPTGAAIRQSCDAPTQWGADAPTASERIREARARYVAQRFDWDEDEEDAGSAAQRAADILRDLSPDDVPAFLARIFGAPVEDRGYYAREISYHRNRQSTEPDYALPEHWQELRRLDREERGHEDIASELVRNWGDIIAKAAQLEDDSTLAMMWGSANTALRAVIALDGFTYGSGPLDGYRDTLDTLASAAVASMLEAVRYAASNALHGDDWQDMREEGMPRAE